MTLDDIIAALRARDADKDAQIAALQARIDAAEAALVPPAPEPPAPQSGSDPVMNLGLGLALTNCRPRLGPNDNEGGDPLWLPPGATTFIDPQDNHAFANGAETSLAAVLSSTSSIVPGDGLVFQKDTTTPVTLIGAALTDLLQGSGVLRFDAFIPYFFGSFTATANNDDDSHERWEADFNPADAEVVQYTGDAFGSASAGSSVREGFNRVVVAYSDDFRAISVNGGATEADTTSVPDTLATRVILGALSTDQAVLDSSVLLSVARFPFTSDAAQLQALSDNPAGFPQFATPPSISIVGDYSVGDVLTCDPGAFTGDATVSVSYQWGWLGVGPLDGETAATHVVTEDDLANAMVCTVSIENAVGGTAKTATFG